MSIQNLTLAGRDFVILPKRDYERLRHRAGELTPQDIGDIAESLRRLAEPGKSIPLSEVRKRYKD
jgi:hypothetical protein